MSEKNYRLLTVSYTHLRAHETVLDLVCRLLLENAFEIKLINIQRGKYFRIMASVLMDGCDLADALINANLGRPYDGGKRLPWNEVNS